MDESLSVVLCSAKEKKNLVCDTYYTKGEFIQQDSDLSAQYGGQQGHSDVHAVLRLTEVCRPRVCVHLHTERKTQEKPERVQAKFYLPCGAHLPRVKVFSKRTREGG